VSHRVEQVMGMPVVIEVRDATAGDETLAAAFAWLRFVDALFSTYKDESEISRINRGELAESRAHPLVRAVLDRCEALREETDGYFYARAASPLWLDPSGLVKGWAVDRAAAILDEAGVQEFAISAGGDMRLRGRWRVGIQHPHLRDKVAAIVEADDLAIATSGTYARGEHVFDPHSGLPPTGVLSVTIVGPELATADAYATAAFAMGAAGPDWTARLPGYDAMTVLTGDVVVTTPGFRRLQSAAARAISSVG
jgi:thiamine biosynthesis lipoprotein